MNAPSRNSTLHRPGPEDWDRWTQDPRGEWQEALARATTPDTSIVALPATTVCAIPLWVNSSEPEVVRGMIRVQMESRGLQPGPAPDESVVTFWKVREVGDRVQILAVALLDQDVDSPGTATARQFELSPTLLEAPPATILLWRELGHWVVAFTRGSEIAYFQTLSGRELDEEAFREIQVLQEALLAQDFIDPPQSLELREPDPAGQVGGDSGRCPIPDLPLSVVPAAAPHSPRRPSGLVPAVVARHRARRKLRRRIATGIIGLMTLYLVFIGSWAFRLARKENEISTLRQRVEEIAPLATRIREARIHAETVRPAIDYTVFPLERFHRCVELLPEQGVRLTHFETAPGKILLRGEASSSNAAVSWKARLLGSEAFRDFEWDFPQPKILPDNRARFTAEGTQPGILLP